MDDVQASVGAMNKRLDSFRYSPPKFLPLHDDQHYRTGRGTIFEGSGVLLSMRSNASDVRVLENDKSVRGGGGGGGGVGVNGGGGGGVGGVGGVVQRAACSFRDKSSLFSHRDSPVVYKRPRTEYDDYEHAADCSADQRPRKVAMSQDFAETKPVSRTSTYSHDTHSSYSNYGNKSVRASAYRTRLCPDRAKCRDMDCPDAHFKSEHRCKFFWDWGAGDKGCQRRSCAFLHS